MKTLFDLTREIAEAQSIASPQPPLFDVVFSIYEELGGSNSPTTTYGILQAMLDEGLVSGGGGITPSGSLEILENGEYDVTHYASASVNVPQGVFPSGNLAIVENGDYNVENFVSTSVNVPQGVFPEGTLTITQSGTYEVTTYSSASVNVPTGSGGSDIFDDLVNAGYSGSEASEVRNIYESLMAWCVSESTAHDTHDWTIWSGYFSPSTWMQNRRYDNPFIPYVDTSNGEDFSNMFKNNGAVYIPKLDTSKGTNFSYMFQGTYNLKKVPALDTSKGTKFTNMFYECQAEEIPKMDMSSGDSTSFGPGFLEGTTRLKNLGGFTGLSATTIRLSSNPNLTRQSVINLITEGADRHNSATCSLKVSSDTYNRLLPEDFALAISKNWNITT